MSVFIRFIRLVIIPFIGCYFSVDRSPLQTEWLHPRGLFGARRRWCNTFDSDQVYGRRFRRIFLRFYDRKECSSRTLRLGILTAANIKYSKISNYWSCISSFDIKFLHDSLISKAFFTNSDKWEKPNHCCIAGLLQRTTQLFTLDRTKWHLIRPSREERQWSSAESVTLPSTALADYT